MPPAVVSALQHFVLPDLGEGLADAELVAWHVAVGDVVALNQVLVEVATEKAVVELPSPFGGTVVELMVAVGETISVGAPLIAIDSDTATATPTPSERDTARADAVGVDEKVPLLVGYGPSEAPPSRRRRNGSGHRERVPAQTPTTPARPLAAPPVRFMARQNGIDLADVTGHGPGGIITARTWRHTSPGRGRPRGARARRGRPCGGSKSTWLRPWSAAWPPRRRLASSSPSMRRPRWSWSTGSGATGASKGST